MSGHGKPHPRNEYFAWLSHKVRQPMNSVVEAINHLLAMDLPDFQRDYIQALGRSTHDLVMIINDVLDTVRIDEGNFYLAEMPFDVRSAVEGVIEDLGSDVVERGLEMQCLIHPDMPAMLRGDPGRLRQALADMIRIALALSPVSDLFVDVTIQTENSEKAIIRFGVGTSVSQISEILVAQLNEWSAASLTTLDAESNAPGSPMTRLRFVLCQRLAQLMGGTFDVSSHGGSIELAFTVAFEKQKPESLPTGAWAGPVDDLHILLIDDSMINRKHLSEWLRSWSAKVTESQLFNDGVPILRTAAAAGEPIDLVMISTELHYQDGESLGRAIKNDPELADTSLVMITAVGRRGDAARLQEIGFAAYLVRPVTEQQLYECVRTIAFDTAERKSARSRSIITRHSIQEERRRTFRVLVADPNPLSQLIVTRTLERNGYPSTALSDADALVEMAHSGEFHLAIVDAKLLLDVEKDTAAALRSTKNGEARIPVLGLYDIERPADGESLRKAGVDRVLGKPVQVGDLLRYVEEYFLDTTDDVRPPRTLERRGILDIPRLMHSFDFDRELLREVASRYIDDAEDQFLQLREAVNDKNPSKAAEVVASIKDA
ncbi:response regulator, partial [bacterium]|nr:response regulator [bacterium]